MSIRILSIQKKMYTLENLRRIAGVRGIQGAISHFGTKLNRKYYGMVGNDSGKNIVEENWDNLLILDGCRYDMFAEQSQIEGDLQMRRSLGSESSEFIRSNFVDRTLHDTVYITANPYASLIPNDTFHYIENLLEEEWDDELKTVPPESVVKAVRDAQSRFPNKRIIAHFMQPHYPFISDFGQEIDSGGFSPDDEEVDVGIKIWTRLQYGLGVNSKEVWRAYRENLDIVLGSVNELLADIEGRTVVTADHGNLVGERQRPIPVRGYGHPARLYVDELINVPWLIIESDERREIRSDPPLLNKRLNDDNINDRLEALGYR